MYYVGLDVGQTRSSLEILDDHGQVFKRQEVVGPWSAVIEAAGQIPRPFAICYEASCGYGYLHDRLAALADRVVVAHPGQLRLIYRSKRKNNRLDAGKLAKLLCLDLVPRVHVPSPGVRQWRAMIEYRQRLLRRRTAVKNQIRALLRGLGIAAIKGLWAARGRQWLSGQELSSLDAVRRDLMVDELQSVSARIRKLEKELGKMAADHPRVALLKTIPGVGVRTAEAFVAYVDDVRRFSSVKQVSSYFGLVPCQDASGDVNRLGHITRDGPGTMRALLAEAAWQGVRRSPTIRGFFERVMRDDPDRRKTAIVATANYLVRVMTAMLRTGEVWRESVVADPPRRVSSEEETAKDRPRSVSSEEETARDLPRSVSSDRRGSCNQRNRGSSNPKENKAE